MCPLSDDLTGPLIEGQRWLKELMGSHVRMINCFRLLALILCVSQLSAQVQQQAAGTWLGEALTRKADAILLARFKSSTVLPQGDRLVRFDVVRVLKGSDDRSVLVHANDERLLANSKMSKLLFLKRSSRGALRSLVDVVDCPSSEVSVRTDLVNRLIQLDEMKNRNAQSFAIRELVLSAQPSNSAWVRTILCREFEKLCATSPEVFSTRDLLQLLKFGKRGLGSADQIRLRRAIHLVEKANALGWTTARLVFPNAATRRLFLEEHVRYQRTSDPKVRRQFLTQTCRAFGVTAAPILADAMAGSDLATVGVAIHLAGEIEAGACVEELRRLLGGRIAVELREKVIEALGKIGDAGCVEALGELITDQQLGDATRLALARINTGDASLMLKDLLTKRRATGNLDDPIWVQLRYLSSQEFRRDEQRRILATRKRWRRQGN